MGSTRLQFRWQKDGEDWLCHYELVLALHNLDIRCKDSDGKVVRDEHAVLISTTTRSGGPKAGPCRAEDDSYFFDVPYRDGAHATWDAPKLGGLPIVCIAPDGTVIPKAAALEPT